MSDAEKSAYANGYMTAKADAKEMLEKIQQTMRDKGVGRSSIGIVEMVKSFFR